MLRLIATGLLAFSAAGADAPPMQWAHTLASPPHAAPLVADMHPSPGREIIVADAEGGTVYCLSGQGAVLWEFQNGADAPLRGTMALGRGRERDTRLLAVPAGDAVIVLDAATGAERHQAAAGPMGLGGACWADLHGDEIDVMIVSTMENGAAAFDAEGTPLWAYTAEDHGAPLRMNGPPAAADADEDRIPELFFVAETGPFCLDADGRLQWRGESEGRFLGAAAVTPPDRDGVPRLYCVSAEPPALHAYDAATGDALWQTPLQDAPDDATANAIALADLDHDEHYEVLVGDASGRVYVVADSGKVLWKFQAQRPGSVAIAVGDVSGDGGLDVLIASADHGLYCLDRAGALQWRHEADDPLFHAPALADADGDGRTQILFGAGDKAFRSLGPGGPHVPALMPWPGARADAARLGRPAIREAFELDEGVLELIPDTAPLLLTGGFELPAPDAVDADASPPLGWTLESSDGAWVLDETTKFAGKSALKVQPANEPIVIVSETIAITPDLRYVNASVMAHGQDGMRAVLRWRIRDGVAREEAFVVRGSASDLWRRHVLHQARPPLDATGFQVVLRAEAPGETVWWDEAQAEGNFERVPQARVFINQVGYEIHAPKRFTVWTSFPARSGRFAVTTASGPAYEGNLHGGERLIGAFNSDWGGYYWQGDFTAFDTRGSYTIAVELEGAKASSPSFDIGPHLLWDKTVPQALRAFTLHRCGATAPGRSAACHLDDACGDHSLAGGWHDGSDYDKTHALEYLWRLVNAYGVVRWRIDAAGPEAQPGAAWLEEIKWGAELALKAVKDDGAVCPMPVSDPEYWGPPELETDNEPGTGDERRTAGNEQESAAWCAAALARLALLFPEDNAQYLAAARRIVANALQDGATGPLLFSAAMDLHQIAPDDVLAKIVRAWYPGAEPACAEAVIAYDALDMHASFNLAMALQARADAFLACANNPFGVCARNEEERADFFGAGASAPADLIGNTSYILEAAHTVAQAYRFKPAPEYAVFIYDQLNWILGNNPFGISLMEGMGTHFAPSYLHRAVAAGASRAAIAGIIAHGIRGNTPGDERPAFDMSGDERPDPRTNACSLRANAQWLSTLANLKRLRLGE